MYDNQLDILDLMDDLERKGMITHSIFVCYAASIIFLCI